MIVYLAPEVDSIVEKLAPNLDVSIVSVFEERKKCHWLGKVTKANPTVKLLTNYEVILHIWKDAWDSLSDNQKEALVFHELCHIDVSTNKKGEKVIRLLPHPVEEFPEVVERYGLWTFNLRRMGDVIEDVIHKAQMEKQNKNEGKNEKLEEK